MNALELLRIPKGSPGLYWILKNYYEFLRITMNSWGFQRIKMNSKKILWILKNYYGFQWIPQDYNEF